jgi:hypothetical protein
MICIIMVIETLGSVSTVDADMSHAIDGCADILDRLRHPDGISVPTRLQASCPSRETVRATSPADDAAPRSYGLQCCTCRRDIARDARACGPCRPWLNPSPAALGAGRDPAHQRHARHSHPVARRLRRTLGGENGLPYVVFTER